MTASLKMTKGADLNFSMVWWADATKTVAMDLTGMSVSAYGAHPALSGRLTLAITNAATGAISGRIEWDDAMPIGAIMRFRVRISEGEDSDTSPELVVVVE